MRLFSEEVKVTSSNSPRNILQVKDFSEVFFGVFEVQINENKYVVEKISEENGNPIVCILVENDDTKAQYPFLLLKGKQEIYFNPDSEPVEIFESKIENQEDEDLEIEKVIEESFDNPEIFEDKKQQILEEIKRVKRNATKKSLEILEHNKAKKIQEIKEESKKKEKALKEYLESARENLVDEFTIISGKIKNELISDNDYKFDEIRESIDHKIKDIADNLSESLKKNFQNSSKLIDKSVKQLVKELYESNINPKVDKELHNIAEEIVEKVSEIDKNLNNKLNKKADVSLIEGVNKELDAIRDANIELNNSINKGVQKALSRVGNVDKKILEISEKFDNKISQTEQEITQYFDEKLSLIKEETLDITDEARKYFQDLIQESRNGLLSEIRKIKDEKPVEYILESKKGEPIVKDWDSIEKEWNKKIHDKFENYKTDLRKYVAVYASGGGTNATQYQDGGTINGDLNINGAILSGGQNILDILGGLQNPIQILEFDTAYAPTGNESIGSMYWNATDGTVDLIHDGATQQIGQEMFIKVRNTTGATIPNGTPVYFNGRTGNRPRIFPAKADSQSTSMVMGVTTQDIDHNSDGFITTFGYVRQIKTNYSGSGAWGTTWNEGDNLYVSKSVAGQLTNVEPSVPHHSDIVGQVGIIGGAGVGSIFVSIRHHWTLEQAADVNGTPLSATGQIPVWNATLSAFDFNYNINDITPVTNNPVRTTVVGDGLLSTFPINGADFLLNASALIVAIDGALQEPDIDYTVSYGEIYFTAPLLSGAKAVIVAPYSVLVSSISATYTNYTEITSNYNVTSTDSTIDATSNNDLSVQLPTAAGRKGLVYNIKNSGTGTLTLSGYHSETIDGVNSIELYQYDSLSIQSTNTKWIII